MFAAAHNGQICCRNVRNMYAATGVPQVSTIERRSELQTALCYGRNSMLLLTRQWTLMQLGCSCDAVMDDAGYRTRLSRSSPAVIVLCETLSREERNRAARLAAELSPASRIVMVFTRLDECVPHMAHILFHASDGRKALARNVSELLERHRIAVPAMDS